MTTRASSFYANQIGFTGRYLDKETGLWFFRARYYSSNLGRFTGRDALEYVNGLGLYNGYYVPNYRDPSGYCSSRDCEYRIKSRGKIEVESVRFEPLVGKPRKIPPELPYAPVGNAATGIAQAIFGAAGAATSGYYWVKLKRHTEVEKRYCECKCRRLWILWCTKWDWSAWGSPIGRDDSSDEKKGDVLVIGAPGEHDAGFAQEVMDAAKEAIESAKATYDDGYFDGLVHTAMAPCTL